MPRTAAPASACGCTDTARTATGYVGVLQNQPQRLTGLSRDARIEFESRHICGVAFPDEGEMAPLIVVGLDVLAGTAWPAWVTRVVPHWDMDSGWRVVSESEAQRDGRVRAMFASTMFRAFAVLDSVIEVSGNDTYRWDEAALEYVVAQEPPGLAAIAEASLGQAFLATPDPHDRVLVSRRALEQRPRLALRTAPDEPRGPRDSGWILFVGDESDAYLDDASSYIVLDIGSVLALHPYLERVLIEPGESEWKWDDEEGDWVQVVER